MRPLVSFSHFLHVDRSSSSSVQAFVVFQAEWADQTTFVGFLMFREAVKICERGLVLQFSQNSESDLSSEAYDKVRGHSFALP